MSAFSNLTVEEHLQGDTRWIAIRARGAEWSWLTPEEAADLGRQLAAKYGTAPQIGTGAKATELAA
jgi:hypothetical protein